MRSQDLAVLFKDKMEFNKAMRSWRAIPDVKVAYMLILDTTLNYNKYASDIIYFGKANHLGTHLDSTGTGSNRLWDYLYQADKQEIALRKETDELEAKGRTIEIWWCTKPPNGLTNSEYETELLRSFRSEHGQYPLLNKKG